MKRNLFAYVTVVLLTLLLAFPSAQAQRSYNEFSTQDSVHVQYKWQRSNILVRDSDAVLALRVTNQDEHAVKWTFSVGFYEKGVLVFESEKNELCLRAGQSRRGGLAGLRFTREDMSLDDVEKETFAWDFTTFEVERVESCD